MAAPKRLISSIKYHRTNIALSNHLRVLLSCYQNKAGTTLSPTNRIANVADHVTISPNPFTHAFNIHLNAIRGDEIQVLLLDATGRRVARQHINAQETGIQKINLSGATIPEGLYMLSIRQNGSTRSYRVIKR